MTQAHSLPASWTTMSSLNKKLPISQVSLVQQRSRSLEICAIVKRPGRWHGHWLPNQLSVMKPWLQAVFSQL